MSDKLTDNDYREVAKHATERELASQIKLNRICLLISGLSVLALFFLSIAHSSLTTAFYALGLITAFVGWALTWYIRGHLQGVYRTLKVITESKGEEAES